MYPSEQAAMGFYRIKIDAFTIWLQSHSFGGTGWIRTNNILRVGPGRPGTKF